MSAKTIFEQILAEEIPVQKIYEDEHTIAFKDINPQAPVHVLVIPKQKLINVASATSADAALLGNVLIAAKNVAEQLGIDKSGYRIVFNNGAHGGQSVNYLHCHVLGGRPLTWPPG